MLKEEIVEQKEVVVLSGLSGSGKSAAKEILCDKYGYNSPKSWTSRDPREGENSGGEYIFKSRNEIKRAKEEGLLATYSPYDREFYAYSKQDINEIENPIVTSEAKGVEQLRKNGYKVILIYIEASLETRMERMESVRKDDKKKVQDKLEADEGNGISQLKNEADYIVINEKKLTLEELAYKIHTLLHPEIANEINNNPIEAEMNNIEAEAEL